jgi:uncharacterized protein YfaS (alpha-2-macroglobulin family)
LLYIELANDSNKVMTRMMLPVAKDYRSTIFWKPDLVTDKEGNGTVSFFAADGKGSYTITLEGTDGNGTIGSSRAKVKIR